MQTARLIEMGQLTTLDLDGQRADYPMALLLTFDDAEAIRAAIRDGKVQFVFGDDPMPNADEGIGAAQMMGTWRERLARWVCRRFGHRGRIHCQRSGGPEICRRCKSLLSTAYSRKRRGEDGQR